MAIAGNWNFANGTVPATPGSGIETLYFDTADGRPKFLGNDGIVHSIDMTQLDSAAAASGAINTVSTIITSGTSGIRLSANQLTVGSMIRARLMGTNTSSVGNASTFTLYYGTNGTTADYACSTFAITSAASGTTIPFALDLIWTVRTVGGSGTLYGYGTLNNNGTTGIYTVANLVQACAGNLAIASNAAGYLNIGYVSAAATTTTTFQNAIIEVIKK